MKRTVFKGAATALITPLNERGIDYAAFERLVNWQIEQGINALVVCGTTGESATLTDAEHKAAIEFVVKCAKGRVPVIAGTGSNHTDYAVELTRFAQDVGADAALVVTPYYNKTTQNGLIHMYSMLADCSDLPIIMYNVPSRTGINIEPQTYSALAEHKNIVAIKEANSNISKIVDTCARVRGKLDVYSGNDDQIIPILGLGGKGVISVLSNVVPKETALMCKRFFEGDIEGANDLQFKFNELIALLFCEVNPIPVKAAMAKLGFCDDYLRMPLVTMEKEHRAKLYAEMERLNIKA